MISRRVFLQLSLVVPAIIAAATASAWAADAPPEPRLFRTNLRIEPTARQVATMPAFKAEWRVAPSAADSFNEVIRAAGFTEEIAQALKAGLTRDRKTGEGVIRADRALLERFTEAEHVRWWLLLAANSSNPGNRWPVAVRAEVLTGLEVTPGFREAVARVRRHALRSGDRLLFGDLFVLEGAFGTGSDRIAFFKELLGAQTEFIKIDDESVRRDGVVQSAAYWESSGRSRAVEPFLNAIARIEGHDRVDLVHLLPRLARALLYTFPPDFAAAEEASVENAAMVAGFFEPLTSKSTAMETGYVDWLGEHCQDVTGEPREFGDIVVFEDVRRTKWPFSMVYIADGVVFGRRPTLYGPWELLEESTVPVLNPRLRGAPMAVYRMRPPKDGGTNLRPPRVWPGPSALQDLPAGPWGRLRFYDVLLAPSTDLLAALPAPDRRATWSFRATDTEILTSEIERIEMPAKVRQELDALFESARTERKGVVTVRPSDSLVMEVPAEFRSRLFPRLIHGSRASDYAQDVLIPTRVGAADWFLPELLPDGARQAVLKLVYPRGSGLMLSDFGAFYHSVKDPNERILALRALYRTPALVVLLERPEPGETAGIADYWRLDQQKSVGAILDSFARVEGMRYLDIVHLLPPLARELMNVYMPSTAGGPTPSCYWSSLNFAAERPDSRLLVTPDSPGNEGKEAWKKLQAGYEQIGEAGRLGDLIVYRDRSEGLVLHMCAYVAADVVYTKNGFGYSSPWCLMHLEDVDALYRAGDNIERLVFRVKEQAK